VPLCLSSIMSDGERSMLDADWAVCAAIREAKVARKRAYRYQSEQQIILRIARPQSRDPQNVSAKRLVRRKRPVIIFDLVDLSETVFQFGV
jgi:hypothetical protein